MFPLEYFNFTANVKKKGDDVIKHPSSEKPTYYDFVVALYDANLSYLVKHFAGASAVNSKFPPRLFIYNKGPYKRSDIAKQLNGFPFIYTRLENVGRNDHSYLYHIIKNYDDLSEVTVFFTDSSNQIEIKRQAFERLMSELNYMNINKNNSFVCPHARLTNPYFYMDKYKRRSYPQLCNELVNDPPSYYSCISSINRLKGDSEFIKADIRPLKKWKTRYLPEKPLKDTFCALGIFAAHKSAIRSNPITIYQRLIKQLEVGDNVETGHYMERLWYSLLGGT